MRYSPDSWVVLEIEHEDETIHKLLAGFSGGYTHGDSWKLNSGITQIDTTGHKYLVHGFSGSVYGCPKHREGMNVLLSFVLEQLQEVYPSVAVVPMGNVLEQYRKKEDES